MKNILIQIRVWAIKIIMGNIPIINNCKIISDPSRENIVDFTPNTYGIFSNNTIIKNGSKKDPVILMG